MAGGSAVPDDTDESRPEATEGQRSSRAQWTVVLGLTVTSASMAAYEIAPASVSPLLQSSLDLTGTEVGLIVSVMFGVGVLASLPAGAVLDRTNSRSAVAVSVGVAVAVGVWGWLAGQAGSYVSVLASRFVGGIAFVVLWNASIDIVSRAVDADRRATAVGVFTTSGPIGFALGQSTGPSIAAWFGLPAIFLAFNLVAVVGLAAFWLPSRGLGRADTGPAPTFAEFRDVLATRSVWLVGSVGFLAYALFLFVNSWAPSYLTGEVGLTLGLSGVLVAVFPGVGVASRIAGGALSDTLFGGRRRPVLVGSFLVTAPFLFVFATVRTVAVLVVALLVAGFAIQLTMGLMFTYVRELVEPKVAATAVAFQTTLGLAGGFVSPIAGGALVESVGYEPTFLLAAALAVVGIGVASLLPAG
jgi:predicted MFS family arabinose efflux permease